MQQIGQLIPGKGVFIGLWKPKDREGKDLGKTFHLFVAPYDLGLDENGRGRKQHLRFDKAVKAVEKIGNLMSHKGIGYADDTALYAALRSDSYKGEWFIPTQDIMNGRNADDDLVQDDTLCKCKNSSAFRSTLATAFNGFDFDNWYLSCTERCGDPSSVLAAALTDNSTGWTRKNGHALSTRLVRAEVIAP